LLFLTGCGNTEYRRFQMQGIGYFDSFVIFTAYAPNEAAFSHYAVQVFERLHELHQLFDIFRSHDGVTGLYQVNANAGISPVTVPQEVISLLQNAQEAYALTHGVVNITLGPVLHLWRTTSPCEEALQHAAQYANIHDMIIENNTIFLQRAGMSLDVGSIAKGYAAALVMEMLAQGTLPAALLNLGGHIAAYNAPPNRNGWAAEIANTAIRVSLSNATLSVSSAFERAGHIVDPTSLHPARRFAQVAVQHECAWTADILSTALFILPKEEGMQLAQAHGAHVFYLHLEE